jgi:hypothetical protein
MTHRKPIRFWTAALALGVCAAAMAQGGRVLIMNGRSASRDVRMIGGKPYVPLADVARALGQQLVSRSGGYEIIAAGGANQVEGMRGKIGDTLFDGRWRFQVIEVQEVDSYRMKTKATNDYAVYRTVADFDPTSDVFRPHEGQTMLLIRCRVKNGVKQTLSLWRSNSDTQTALTDTQGQSYPPIAYDMEESAPFQSKALLPGSSLDLGVLFVVPQGTVLKDLLFTLRTLDDKGHDVRVSLRQ